MFEVKKHLIKVSGNRLYLPVAARLVWFRQEHPDWGIETRPVVIDTEKQFAIFEAMVYNAEGRLMAKGTKMENVRGFPDYIEKAETGAIGRALAVCGFGTQFAPDLDEVTNGRIVDSPQPGGRPAYSNGNGNDTRREPGPTAEGGSRFDQPNEGSQRPQPRPAESMTSVNHTGNSAATRPANGINANSGGAEAEAAEREGRPHVSPTPVTVGDAGAAEHECAGCGRGLTKGQEALSVRKYGIALCPDCQKERRTAEAGV